MAGRGGVGPGGRGRGATLPAWMTSGKMGDASAAPSVAAVQSGATPPAAAGAVAPAGGQHVMQPASSAMGKPPAPGGVWSEHSAPDGRKYYHNKITNQSTWDKPEELKTPMERSTTCQWKEYTADSGRKYYYNTASKQTVWDMPEEYKAMLDATGANGSSGAASAVRPAQSARPIATTVVADPLTAKREESSAKYRNKEEATTAFKSLLRDARISSTTTWDQAMPLIINDPRYGAIKNLNDKKMLFQEFTVLRKKEEKEEKRDEVRKQRSTFFEMLSGIKELTSTSKYRKSLHLFEQHPTFKAVASSRDREDFFYDYVDELAKKEKENERESRRENMARFRALLERTESVTLSSQWRKVQYDFENEDCFKALDKVDRLQVFEDHLRALDKADAERRERDKQDRGRNERKARDAFRELLAEHKKNGNINMKTRWRKFKDLIVKDARYEAVLGQRGSTARDMFDDVIEDLEDLYEDDRRVVKEAYKASKYNVKVDTKFEDFRAALPTSDKLAAVPDHHVRYYFEEQVDKAIDAEKDREKSEKKKKVKAEDKFYDFLYDEKVDPNMRWEDVKDKHGSAPEFKADILTESDLKGVWQEYVDRKLKKKRDRDDSDSASEEGAIEDPHSKRHKKSHKEKKEKKDRKDKKEKRHYDDDRDYDREKKRSRH